MTGTSKTRAVGDCACWLPNLFTKFTTSMQIIYKIGRLPLFSGWRRLLLLSWAGLLMPLQKQLIALTPKKLIACRECQVNADVSMNGSNVKLICPSCYHTLGSWATKTEALADITAFVIPEHP